MSPSSASLAYAKAAIGDATPWGPAEPFCARGLDGRWACATHGVASFVDGAEMAAHVDEREDPCLIAWRCRACGRVHGVRR